MVLITAHMDFCFRGSTDVALRRERGLLYAPGISDRTERGLRALLGVARAMHE